MKVRSWVAAAIIFTTATMGAQAFGLGAQFNINAGRVFSTNVAALLSPSDNTHLAVNWRIGGNDNVNAIGLTLDFTPLNLQLVGFSAGSLNFTFGGGIFTTLVFGDDIDFGTELGLRLPIGVNVLLVERVLEIFLHVAPSWGVEFLPSIGLGDFFCPIALGARLWFR